MTKKETAVAKRAESTEYASKDDLFTTGMEEEDFVLPDGKKVRIRSLTRQEAHELSSCKDTAMSEQIGLSGGLVQPKITRKEAETWMLNAGSGYLQPLIQAIQKLSGMAEGADKEAFQEVRPET